ncbi:hypothetical protein AMTRI_Chr07g31140 [Amborella trichopoda]
MLQRHTVQRTSSSALISAFAKESTIDLATVLGVQSTCEDASMPIRCSRLSVSICRNSPSKIYCEVTSMNMPSSSSNSINMPSSSSYSVSASGSSSSSWRVSYSVSGSEWSPSAISLSCLISIKNRNCTCMLGWSRERALSQA